MVNLTQGKAVVILYTNYGHDSGQLLHSLTPNWEGTSGWFLGTKW